MAPREQLETNVKAAKAAAAEAETALAAFDSAPENNRFNNMDDAYAKIEDKLMDRAHADCEGSHNCGADQYTQDFYVGDKLYRGTLKCEYNRHDKTYYYIDGHDFAVTEVA